ncbi:hypothetical protein CUU66_04440 [Peribacillus deserti]|uniref:Uncharacterized protein n=1 Tax=Peribacillus deserti TaxID=673318 RepID=A0A2N5M9M9_9BACI|nr:hypothetical protein CUU66_04440 [Peribacillus deserti]
MKNILIDNFYYFAIHKFHFAFLENGGESGFAANKVKKGIVKKVYKRNYHKKMVLFIFRCVFRSFSLFYPEQYFPNLKVR